jgi:hypothetical protein
MGTISSFRNKKITSAVFYAEVIFGIPSITNLVHNGLAVVEAQESKHLGGGLEEDKGLLAAVILVGNGEEIDVGGGHGRDRVDDAVVRFLIAGLLVFVTVGGDGLGVGEGNGEDVLAGFLL